MTAELARLRDLSAKGAAAAAETESLRQQVDALQKKLDALQVAPATPPASSPKAGPSWLDGIKGMFRKAPEPAPAPTGAVTPSFRTSVALRQEEEPFPAPGITILPGVTIASASLPQEFYRMPLDDESRLRAAPVPARRPSPRRR